MQGAVTTWPEPEAQAKMKADVVANDGDSGATAAEATSPGRNALDAHRSAVECATFDEIEDSGSDLSVASTVDVDNTHPYLVRCAVIHAKARSDGHSVNAGPKFIDVNPPSQIVAGQHVLYNDNGNTEAAVTKEPQYTIKLESGKLKQPTSESGNQKWMNAATDENGHVPVHCVNFKKNPTLLFELLYNGNWHDAQERAESHPEEAGIWVARFAKNKDSNNGSLNGNLRWQLLPLHLCIALGGRGAESTKMESESDVPDDEVDELDQTGRKPVDGRIPPNELLTAVLSAYPHATQCTDDRGMIPLHSAIRGNASLKVIEQLLQADPYSVYRKDSRGRNTFMLVEKVFAKNRGEKYSSCMHLLSVMARKVSSPITAKPNEKASQDIQQMKQEDMTKIVHRLQNDNLALRRENADLRNQAEINNRLLQKLVDKLQMYEKQRSVDIENYNEIFGSKDEINDRREEILLSISEEDDDQVPSQDTKTEEPTVGGNGAYLKRLERYHKLTPAGSKDSIDVASPPASEVDATKTGDGMSSDLILILDECTEEINEIGVAENIEQEKHNERGKSHCDSKEYKNYGTSSVAADVQDIFRLHDGFSEAKDTAQKTKPSGSLDGIDSTVVDLQ